MGRPQRLLAPVWGDPPCCKRLDVAPQGQAHSPAAPGEAQSTSRATTVTAPRRHSTCARDQPSPFHGVHSRIRILTGIAAIPSAVRQPGRRGTPQAGQVWNDTAVVGRHAIYGSATSYSPSQETESLFQSNPEKRVAYARGSWSLVEPWGGPRYPGDKDGQDVESEFRRQAEAGAVDAARRDVRDGGGNQRGCN